MKMYIIQLDKKYIKRTDDGLRECSSSCIRDSEGKKQRTYRSGQKVILLPYLKEPKQTGTVC